MEAGRGEVVVVAAGYPAQMSRFLEVNPGLTSRFSLRLNFDDYDAKTLEHILVDVFAPERHVTVAEDARERLSGACLALTRAPGYANARSARTLFERWLIKQATLGAGGTLTDAALEAALAEDNLASPGKHPMGFA